MVRHGPPRQQSFVIVFYGGGGGGGGGGGRGGGYVTHPYKTQAPKQPPPCLSIPGVTILGGIVRPARTKPEIFKV